MRTRTVFLADPLGADVNHLASFFVKEKKMVGIDAQRLARRSWGMLGDCLSEEEAQALVHSAQSAGIRAVAIDTETIAPLPDAEVAHGAVWEKDRLLLKVGIPAVDRVLPLGMIRLLSVITLRQDKNVARPQKEEASLGKKIAGMGILLTTGIPTGMGKSKEINKTVIETEWRLHLDIFSDGGRWRVGPSGFDFSCLGPEKGTGGPENLRRLLGRLHQTVPRALLNRAARWWLDHRPLHSAGYDEMADVDRESRWLLTLAAQGPGKENPMEGEPLQP